MRRRDLLEAIDERAAEADGAARQRVLRRSFGLRLEAGRVEEAARSIVAMLESGMSSTDVADLVDLLGIHPKARLGLDLLYSSLVEARRVGDAIRLAKLVLDRAVTNDERVARVRRLVQLRMIEAREAGTPLVEVVATVSKDAGSGPRAATAAYRAVLVRLLVLWRRAPTDAEFDAAGEAVVSAVERLVGAHRRARRQASAARLLERAARLRFDRVRQRVLLSRAAVAYAGEAEDAERAMRLMNEIFQEGDSDEIALSLFDRYVALLDRARRWPRLALVLEGAARRAARAADATGEQRFLIRAGALWERAGEHDRAVDVFARAAVRGDPRAYEGLARVHAATGRWREAAGALEWLCGDDGAQVAQASHVLGLAEAYVALGDDARAQARLEDLLRAVPEAGAASRTARERLRDLHRRTGSFRALADRLEDDARLCRGRAAGSLLAEAAEVRRSKLDDPEGAIRLLELAAARDPASAAVRLRLAELLEERGRDEDAVAVLSAKHAIVGPRRSAEKVAIRRKLAEVLERLGRRDEALVELRRAARLSPTNPATRLALARLERACGNDRAAERALSGALLVLQQSTHESAEVSRVEVLLELAAIAAGRGKSARKNGFLESAFDAALEEPDRRPLVEVALLAAGRHDLLRASLEIRYALEEDLGRRVLVLRELAELWSTHLGRAPDVADEIRRRAAVVVERTPVMREDIWSTLSSVCAALGDEALLARLLSRRVEWIARTTSAAERAAGRREVARALLATGGRIDEAIEQLSMALKDDPADVDAAQLLAVALERDGRLVEAADVLASRLRWLDAEAIAPAELDAFALGAVDALRRAGRTVVAEQELERLLERSPADAGALERLAAIAFESGSWDRAATCYARLLEVILESSDPSARLPSPADVVIALADACEYAGRPPGYAAAALERAHRRMPWDDRLAERLARTYEAMAAWPALVEHLAARAERTADAAPRAKLLVRAAHLALVKVGTPRRARALLEAARAALPDSVEAALVLARVETILGRPGAAIQILEPIVRRRDRPTPLLAAVYLELARAHLAADELVEALERLEAGFTIERRDPALALLLGQVAMDLGRDALAERALLAVAMFSNRKVPGAARYRRTALAHLSALAEARGDLVTARTWAEKRKAVVEEDPPTTRLAASA